MKYHLPFPKEIFAMQFNDMKIFCNVAHIGIKRTAYSHYVSVLTDGLREKWNLLFCCLLQTYRVMVGKDISFFGHKTMDGKYRYAIPVHTMDWEVSYKYRFIVMNWYFDSM